MPFRFPDIPSYFISGLALKIINNSFYHIGFIYKKDNIMRMCHLAWHHQLKNEDFNKSDYICDEFKLVEVNKKFLAAAFISIAEENNCTIPYGIQMPIQVFNNQNRYIGTIEGEGLTCATFILTVLEKNGFRFLDKESWEIREEDKKWQKNIIENLKSNPGLSVAYIENAEKLIGEVVRFRPDEVFASGVLAHPNQWPMTFEEVSEMATNIKQLCTN